VLKQLLN